MTNRNDDLQHSYAVLPENNASTFFDPIPTEAAAATKQAVFTAFLAWDGARYDSRPVEKLHDRLRAALSSLPVNGPTTISSKVVRFINQTLLSEDHHDVP